MRRFAALDIGGTSIKYGIVDKTGTVLFDSEIPTNAQDGSAVLVGRVDGIVHELLENYRDIGGLGISTAGIVDTETGTVIYANDLMPGYTGTAWKMLLENRYSLRVEVNNDVNSMALAESWVGSAKKCNNFFCLTLGTGVGGAAFLNGRPYTGLHYHAAEIGYMRTGGYGNYRFDKTASTAALVRTAYEKTREEGLNGKILFQKIRAHEPRYTEVYAEWLDCLAKGICNIICLYDPELLLIGGGISSEGKFLIDGIQNSLRRYLPEELLSGIDIKTAFCRNRAGIIGAVYGLAHDNR